MPARLSGVLDWSGGFLHDRRQEEEWERRYPAPAPWKRTARRADGLKVVVDLCGDSSLSRCLAIDDAAKVGVAGPIRLDRSDELHDELGGYAPVGDAGLVVAAYLKWGARSFSRLSGEFSFVLWDGNSQTSYLVRDPFGVRRLHYAVSGETIVYSTDVEGVLGWGAVDRTPDPVTILDFLLARYQTREETFLRAVKRVPPGHHVVSRRGQTSLVRHVEVPRCGVALRSLSEYGEAFRYELARAVSERLPREGRVACHVSGGLDSTSVAALVAADLAARARSHDLVLMNARFAGLPSDEGQVAHELSRHLGVPVHEWNGRVPETSDLQHSRVGWPFGRSSISGARQGDLELAAGSGATVILGGAGGNQIAMESGFFRDSLDGGDWLAWGHTVAGLLLTRPGTWQPRHLRRTVREAGGALRRPRVRTRAAAPEGPRAGGGPPWLGPGLTDVWRLLPMRSAPPKEPVTGSWMADAVWAGLVDDPVHVWTLEHEDARATERGLEFRFPYLSWSLLALVLSVPPGLRAPVAGDRRLQRLSLRGVLPERIRTRDTFVNFNESIMLNTEAAAQTIRELLVQGPWLSDQFVDRAKAQDEFLQLSRSAGVPFSEERARRWREIRDVAALEAWLRRL